eukprot:970176_1
MYVSLVTTYITAIPVIHYLYDPICMVFKHSFTLHVCISPVTAYITGNILLFIAQTFTAIPCPLSILIIFSLYCYATPFVWNFDGMPGPTLLFRLEGSIHVVQSYTSFL